MLYRVRIGEDVYQGTAEEVVAFMMRNEAVIEQVIHYLQNGQFKRND